MGRETRQLTEDIVDLGKLIIVAAIMIVVVFLVIKSLIGDVPAYVGSVIVGLGGIFLYATNKKVREIVTEINALGDYAAKIETGLDQEPDGKDLFPVADVETKGGAQVYYGTDIHSVIFNPQAPGQYKLALEGRGSDRVQLSFREA